MYFLSALILILSLQSLAQSPVTGRIRIQDEMVSTEFEGRQAWSYKIDKKEVDTKVSRNRVELKIDPLNAETIARFENFKSPLVKNISIQPRGSDGQTIVVFDLVDEEIEFFDYLTDQPARLMIDFYRSEAETSVQKTSKDKKQEIQKNENQNSLVSLGKKSKTLPAPAMPRGPASDVISVDLQREKSSVLNEIVKAGVFDGNDPDYARFEMKDYERSEKPLNDLYLLKFPILEPKTDEFAQIQNAFPLFAITPKDDEENKMARLLLTLYERDRWLVYLKTLGWFKEKFPDSEYNGMIELMTADLYHKKWKSSGLADDFENALLKYSEVVKNYPKLPGAERASFLTGLLSLQRGDSLTAIRFFNSHRNNQEIPMQNTLSKDLALMGIGYAYMKLAKPDEAVDAFATLEKESKDLNLKKEAEYRKGDVLINAKRYPAAVAAFEAAFKKYPEGQATFYGPMFNYAEALFQDQKVQPALKAYLQFIKKFPTHEHVGYAMTRVGEIHQMFNRSLDKAAGAYRETIFKFGENKNALVAKLRLLGLRMQEMKPKEAEQATAEILETAKKIDLPLIEQFSTVLIADGHASRKEHEKAIGLLTDYYQRNPTSTELEPIKKRIVDNIAAQIQSEVDDGKFIKALKTHQKYSLTWLKNIDRSDIRFALGKAFEAAGVSEEAKNMYKSISRSPASEASAGPLTETVSLRVAQQKYNLKDYPGAYDFLKQIKNPEKLSEQEQIERIQLAAQLLEQKGDLDSALRHLNELVRVWKGQTDLLAGVYMDIAELYSKQKQPEQALATFEKIDALKSENEKFSSDIHVKALEESANIYLSQNEKNKAAEKFKKLLELYEEKKPVASLRYKLGQIYFERGDIQKAAEIWDGFKSQDAPFWKNLAKENLKSSQWQGEYKKYIQRIPAMSEKTEKSEGQKE